VLKLWVIDPALVFEKLVVNTGATRQSYLGPPESFLRQKEKGKRQKAKVRRRTTFNFAFRYGSSLPFLPFFLGCSTSRGRV
jgi:hypothetical protein